MEINRITKSLRAFPLYFAVIGFCACSSKIQRADLPENANPTDQIAQLEEALRADEQAHATILAPKEYAEARVWLGKAQSNLQKGKSQSAIVNDLSYAVAYQRQARELSRTRAPAVQHILEARTAAHETGAKNFAHTNSLLGVTDLRMIKASDNFSRNLTAQEMAQIQNDYTRARAAALVSRELGDAKSRLKIVMDADAESYIPHSVQRTKVEIGNAENQVSQNTSNPDNYKPAVQRANASANFLTRVWANFEKHNRKIPESAAIELTNRERDTQRVELQQTINTARKSFNENEAEVFQQGSKLIVRLKGLQFPTGQADLPSTSLELISKVSHVIADLDVRKIVVEGHTDSTGGAEVNQSLSQARAETVATYLKTNGIKAEIIEPVGFGDSKPLASNKMRDGRAQNRRVDVVVDVANVNRADGNQKSINR